MSLFGSLQIAANSLQAQQIGLQVVGQNIANANTPGYSREEVVFTPAPTQRIGSLVLGLGVSVQAVTQKIDQFLEERLRGVISERAGSEVRKQAYSQLEGILGELNDTDLSSSMNRFFSSISEILNQPESVSLRNLAILQGQSLAADVNRLASRAAKARGELNMRVSNMAADINRLTRQIGDLNVRIVSTEAGSNSHAVGLRDQRQLALVNLAQLTGIRVEEQPGGAVSVFSGGDFLVFGATVREVGIKLSADRGLSAAAMHILETDAALTGTSGELAGLIQSRDEILGGFLDQLNQFAGTLAFEFNKIYSSGQGLKGHGSLTAEFPATAANLALDAAGLPFVPVNGQFSVQVRNKQTGLTQTTVVPVDLNGLDDDDATLDSLAAALNSISGLSASITTDRRLSMSVDSTTLEFTFADDTSGVLAALGLNTFFTGSTAMDLGVSAALRADAALFAASRGGVGSGTANAVELAGFLDRPLETADGATLGVMYDRLAAGAAQGSSVAQAVADGLNTFERALRGEQLAISGVNLDEEAVRMITFQHAFQASARFIATISELLDRLVEL